jgi:hypothetical protein
MRAEPRHGFGRYTREAVRRRMPPSHFSFSDGRGRVRRDCPSAPNIPASPGQVPLLSQVL